MAQCWEQYISKIHNAVPLDPWATDVQLLDILIKTGRRCLPRQSLKLARIGSMLNLGDKDSTDWKQNVEDPIMTGLQMLRSESSQTEVSNAIYRAEDLADMQASIKATSSILNSITGKVPKGQMNLDGANAVNCVVTGVKSHRALSDALMDLVTKRGVNELALWRPNIARPEFRWSAKRGQIIWVVTEILYASKITLQDDKKSDAGGNVKASTAAHVGDANFSNQVTVEKDGVWVVTAPGKEKVFPFAYRTTKLEFEGTGILRGYPTSKSSNKSSAERKAGLNRSPSVSKSP